MLFEAFGTLLLENISDLRGVFVNLSNNEKTVCKLTMENLRISLSDEMSGMLRRAGVTAECVCEDDVTYIGFTLPERGRNV